MSSQTKNFPLWLVILIAPVVARATSIEINGTCEAGDCSTAGLETSSIGVGQSTGPGTLTIDDYTIGSDMYDITISPYGANYIGGTNIYIDLSVTYVGIGPSTSADIIRIDELQDFYNSLPGTWDGNYTEGVPVSVGTGTTFEANVCYNGGSSTQCVGQVGPVGAGTYNFNLDTHLTGLGGGDYLAADFYFILDFPEGTAPGTNISIPPIPEPAQTVPVALALAGLLCATRLRKLSPKQIFSKRGEVDGSETTAAK